MSYVTVTWPVVLLVAAIVLIIGVLVAWGVSALEWRTREDLRGERIQMAVGRALAGDPELAPASILTVAGLEDGRPTLALTGSVPSEEARRRAVDIAERELARVRPGTAVVDRLDVVPSAAHRRPA